MASKHRVTVGEELRYDSDLQGLKNLAGSYAPASADLSGGASGAASRSLTAKLADTLNVKDFGAVGNGTTDDTAAIQAALTAIAGSSGRNLFFPSGTYKLTSSLTIPFATGWRLQGASRGSTRLRQATANTPILTLTSDLTHSWEITDLSFDWTSPQSASNTNAVAILFSTGTANHNIFNWQIQRCTFTNGFRAIAVSAANSPLLWGVHISDCTFGGTMTGAAFKASPAGAGLPNICIENCYIDCAGATEPSIAITNGDTVMLRALEFNNGSYATFPQMNLTTCYPVVVTGCKTEHALVSSGSTLWDFPQCDVIVQGCTALLDSAGSGTATFIKAGSNGTLNIAGMNVVASLASGSMVPYQGTTITSVGNVRTGGTTVATDPTLLLGNIAQPKLNLDALVSNRTNARGDVDVTLTTADYRLQYFNTTFTANRTVTLPSTGLVDGLEFEVVREALGAFTLTVSDPVSGKSYVLPASTKGFSRWRARSSSEWVLIAAGQQTTPAVIDVQAFTASGTWTKPNGAKAVNAVVVAGGGGGGSGRRGAAASVRCGGGGGGGAGVTRLDIAASLLGSTETVTVGASGSAGAAVTVDSTDGNAGGAGGTSSFGAWARATGGGGGLGGTATLGTGGAAGVGGYAGSAGGAASGTGGAGGGGSAGIAGAAGGAAGGGVTSADVVSSGGSGATVSSVSATGNGSAGTGGGNGTAGVDRPTNSGLPGSSGGGGASSISAAAGSGGNGGLYGGGAGGGGASLNGNNSGAGGAGAGGIVIVTTYF